MLLSSLLSSRLRDVWPLWRLKIQDRRLQTERRRVTKRIGISSRSFQEAHAEMPIVHSSFSSACCLTAGPTTRLRPHGLGQGTAAWGKRQHLTSASYCFLWGVRYSSETFLQLAGFAKDCWFGWFKGGQLRKICWPHEAGSQNVLSPGWLSSAPDSDKASSESGSLSEAFDFFVGEAASAALPKLCARVRVRRAGTNPGLWL